MTENNILKINKRSFITVCIILLAFSLLTYILTFIIPSGTLVDNVYTPTTTSYSFWKWISSPIRIIASSDGATFIVLSLFIVIISGAFNVMEKASGISSIINYLIKVFSNKKYLLMYVIVLVFMLFGALFGIFEEAVTLLPIIIILALSLGWDTFTGLGMCLLAAGFGFSSAITNPFSVGLGSSSMGLAVHEGILFRIFVFIGMYLLLCVYLRLYIRKIEKKPEASPTYEADQEKRSKILINTEINKKALIVYVTFFAVLLLLIIVSSLLPFLQGLSVVVLTAAFLIGGIICGVIVNHNFKQTLKFFLSGVISMSPAIVMILLAGSIKLVMDESEIIGTIIYNLSNMFDGKNAFLCILFIYAFILIIQFFIGSASAKVILVVPMIAILADNVGITRNIALLSFIFGDGFTDLIYPTNPVLLIALGMAGLSYFKWFKKTWLLQLIVLAFTVLLLYIAFLIGY